MAVPLLRPQHGCGGTACAVGVVGVGCAAVAAAAACAGHCRPAALAAATHVPNADRPFTHTYPLLHQLLCCRDVMIHSTTWEREQGVSCEGRPARVLTSTPRRVLAWGCLRGFASTMQGMMKLRFLVLEACLIAWVGHFRSGYRPGGRGVCRRRVWAWCGHQPWWCRARL